MHDVVLPVLTVPAQIQTATTTMNTMTKGASAKHWTPLIPGGNMFWGRTTPTGRLWHAIREGSMDAACGRPVPLPRSTAKHITPAEDVRCAKCDRLVWPKGDGPKD